MASNLSMCVNAIDGVHIGQCIEGSISFTSQTARRLTDFTMTMTLESRLKTAVPISQDESATTFEIVRNHRVALPWPISCSKTHDFTVPFRMAVPNVFTPTMRHGSMMALEHRLCVKVTEVLRKGRAIPVSDSVSTPVVLLAARLADLSRSSPRVTTFGDIELTASPVARAGETYFAQCQFADDDGTPAAFHVRLASELTIGKGDAIYTKRSERLLTDVKTIVRNHASDERIAIIELLMPSDVEPSVGLAAFQRKHELLIDLVRPSGTTRIPQDVSILPVAMAPCGYKPATFVQSPSIALQREAAPAQSTTLGLHLQQLTMNKLADMALSGVLPVASPALSAAASTCRSYASSEVSSKLDSECSASSTHTLSPASSIRRQSSDSNLRSPYVGKHSRNASSISITSIAQSFKARRSSIVGKLAKRLSFDAKASSKNADDDDLDFSCCGTLTQTLNSVTSSPGHSGPGAQFTFPAIADAAPTAATKRRSSAAVKKHNRSVSTNQLPLSNGMFSSVGSARPISMSFGHRTTSSFPAHRYFDTVEEDESEESLCATASLSNGSSIHETSSAGSASPTTTPTTPAVRSAEEEMELTFWSIPAAVTTTVTSKLMRPGSMDFVPEERPQTPTDKILPPPPSSRCAVEDFEFEYALDTVDRASNPGSPRGGRGGDAFDDEDPFCAWAL